MMFEKWVCYLFLLAGCNFKMWLLLLLLLLLLLFLLGVAAIWMKLD